MAVVFSRSCLELIVTEMMGADAYGLERAVESAVREAGNVLVSHFASAIGDVLGRIVLPSVPLLDGPGDLDAFLDGLRAAARRPSCGRERDLLDSAREVAGRPDAGCPTPSPFAGSRVALKHPRDGSLPPARPARRRARRGALELDAGARSALGRIPFVDLPSARVDTHRALRQGLPEVDLRRGQERGADRRGGGSAGAAAGQVGAGDAGAARGGPSRCCGWCRAASTSGKRAWSGSARARLPILGKGTIAVVSAGTSDLPVAEEAVLTARWLGERGGD